MLMSQATALVRVLPKHNSAPRVSSRQVTHTDSQRNHAVHVGAAAGKQFCVLRWVPAAGGWQRVMTFGAPNRCSNAHDPDGDDSPQVVVADLPDLGRRPRTPPGCACDEGEVVRVAALPAPLAHALHKVVADGGGAAPGDDAAAEAWAGRCGLGAQVGRWGSGGGELPGWLWEWGLLGGSVPGAHSVGHVSRCSQCVSAGAGE